MTEDRAGLTRRESRPVLTWSSHRLHDTIGLTSVPFLPLAMGYTVWNFVVDEATGQLKRSRAKSFRFRRNIMVLILLWLLGAPLTLLLVLFLLGVGR